MSENKNAFMTREENAGPIRAVLVGVVTKDDDPTEVEVGLDELARLLDTAGGETFAVENLNSCKVTRNNSDKYRKNRKNRLCPHIESCSGRLSLCFFFLF